MGACAIVECTGLYGSVAVPEATGADVHVLVVDSCEKPTRPEYEASQLMAYGLGLPKDMTDGERVHRGIDSDGRDIVTIGERGRFQRPLLSVVQRAHPRATWSAGGDSEYGGIAVAKVDGRIVGVVMGCRA